MAGDNCRYWAPGDGWRGYPPGCEGGRGVGRDRWATGSGAVYDDACREPASCWGWLAGFGMVVRVGVEGTGSLRG